ncbi:MAG TPA: AAA family ATPase [Trebonia sp.]|jgi:thymidylate kinase|nr:AAA family ATPase [Trebonia sp.]
MGMSGCTVIAIEGAHGTGKSTLAHAILTHYKTRNVNAGLVAETARRSPFIEDVVIHGKGPLSLEAEIQLFAAHISEEQLAARHHEIMISDKTIANVIGYARLLVAETSGADALIKAMTNFAMTYSRYYDAVFYLSDMYDPALTRDPFRPVDHRFQVDADRYIRGACEEVGLSLYKVPTGLTIQDQVNWVSEMIDRVRIE